MRFDDRPADREPQPQSAFLGREEGVEDTIPVLRIEAGAGIG